MKKLLTRRALAAVLLSLCARTSPAALPSLPAGQAVAPEPDRGHFSPAQQQEIGRIAQAWLLAHPEVVAQAAQALQARQAAQQALAQRTAAVKLAARLTDVTGIPVAGPAGARVAVVEFFDYQCVYCSRMAPVLTEVMKTRPDVRYIFRDWPIFTDRWPESGAAARRGLEVWQQKGAAGYLAYHNGLYATGHNEGQLTAADTDRVSRAAGWRPDGAAPSGRASDVLSQNDMLAQATGLTGTPGFVVLPVSGATPDNTTVLGGAVPTAQLLAAIDRAAETR